MIDRIGLLTFHASYNNGSMLQAYALQNVLKNRYGIEAEIINFSNGEQKRMYSIFYAPRKLKDVFRNALNALFWKSIHDHNKDYIKFSCDNLLVSKKRYATLHELENENFAYKLVIAGSDQVWNINAKDFDDAYFLPFIKGIPKIAYAVSLGATNPNFCADKNKYAEYMQSFAAISVREGNAKKWLEMLGNSSIMICVDPTLLLPKLEWEKLVGEREVKGKYIFWYTRIYKKEIRDIVLQIGKKYGMPVYVMDAKEWSRRGLYLKGIKLVRKGGPSSYLSLIKNAEMVITSSFHGTVFSYIFNKNFWYLNIHDFETTDDRATHLLSQLGLQDRYVGKREILGKDLLRAPDYLQKGLITDQINKSFDYLGKYIIKE